MTTMTLELNTDTAKFADEGYCVFRQLVPPAEIAAARDVLDDMIANIGTHRVVRDGQEIDVPNRPELLCEPQEKDNFWLELCRHPKVLDAVETVLGPNLVLLMTHLIVKPAKDGIPIAWHQDNTYWEGVHGTDVVTVWLALDKVDLGNGAMEIIPSTQAGFSEMDRVKTDGGDLFGYKVVVTAAMEQAAVAIELEPGDASIHDSFVLHGSRANLSDRRRAGYTMRYGNAMTTRIEPDKHFVSVYHVRGDAPAGTEFFIDIRAGKPLPVR